jgi:hypothetical protein
MKINLIHVAFLSFAAIGTLYIIHMVTSHKGESILPGLGI